ncbi:MAG: MATE family efflux transporter [Bacteroidales bacterium]|nr:MATE family efflux transporter [Bacteroidales bacterium]
MSGREQLSLTFRLAVPAILAQAAMCLMSYIDAAMVGQLGSAPAAAIGLVSSTAWIFGSFCYGNASGFSVQIAHRCGAKDYDGAKRILRAGLAATFVLSLVLCLTGTVVSKPLPAWLGGNPDIVGDATGYFLIFSLSLPLFQVAVFFEAVLIASGNIKVPSIASIAMCVLDVGFNALFIFGMNMGARGAALGTALATGCSALFLMAYTFRRSTELRHKPSFLQPMRRFLGQRSLKVEWKLAEGAESPANTILGKALKISAPLWLQNLIVRGAYIAATVLIAPLGTVAIAANAFAIIAEGFCYLPGYGMQDAATTLVGQSLGARRKDMAQRFAFITIGSGAAMMAILAVLMWIFAPQIMHWMSTDPDVVALGARCLRIEAWAELFFGISIVGYGCCIGTGNTMVPSLINILSMWVVRIGLSLLLIPRYGLEGYWMAMATDLILKGVIFALYCFSGMFLRSSRRKSQAF